MRRRSLTRAALERIYSKMAKAFLADHPNCECGRQGCTGIATEVHHKAGREGIRLIMQIFFLAVCKNCHDWITENSKEAIENGWSLNRGHQDVKKAVLEFQNNY